MIIVPTIGIKPIMYIKNNHGIPFQKHQIGNRTKAPQLNELIFDGNNCFSFEILNFFLQYGHSANAECVSSTL